MSGASKGHRIPVAAAVAALFALPSGLGAGAAPRQHNANGPQPIYAAINLVKQSLSSKRCGSYQVFTGTYRGPSNSPDPRLSGTATYVGRLSLLPGGSTGVASGTFTFRNNGKVRARATVNGVMTNRSVVNGLANGTLVAPNAQMRANATLIYDEVFSFIVVRLGMESGANSGVAYPAVPKCRS
jgi:hypothetical protein